MLDLVLYVASQTFSLVETPPACSSARSAAVYLHTYRHHRLEWVIEGDMRISPRRRLNNPTILNTFAARASTIWGAWTLQTGQCELH
jgi:hypothetical protein